MSTLETLTKEKKVTEKKLADVEASKKAKEEKLKKLQEKEEALKSKSGNKNTSTTDTEKEKDKIKEKITQTLTPDSPATKEPASKHWNEIQQEFQREFGIKAEDVAGLKNMHYGQQLMVLNNLTQIKYEIIESSAKKIYQEKVAQAGFLKKIWLGAKKDFEIETNKKHVDEQLRTSGHEFLGEDLAKIIESIKTTGLEVVHDHMAEPEYRIEYIHGLEGLTENEKLSVEHYNRIATEFGQIPYEWAFSDETKIEKIATGNLKNFKRSEKEEFEKTKSDYESSREEILTILLKKEGFYSAKSAEEKEIIQNQVYRVFGQAENNIRFNQFLNANPTAKTELEQIAQEDPSKLTSILKSTLGERGIFLTAGFLARGALKLSEVAGYIQIPGVAGLLSGVRGYYRKQAEIREKTKGARRGNVDEEIKKLKMKFRDVGEKEGTGEKVQNTSLLTKIERKIAVVKTLSDRISELGNAENEAEVEQRRVLNERYTQEMFWLSERITYTQEMLDGGNINFGDESSRMLNQYKITDALNRGYALLAYDALQNIDSIYTNQGQSEFGTGIITSKERVRGALKKKALENEASIEHEKYINKRDAGIKAGLYGALFAGIGYGARHAFEYFNGSEKIGGIFREVFKNLGGDKDTIIEPRTITGSDTTFGKNWTEPNYDPNWQMAPGQKWQGMDYSPGNEVTDIADIQTPEVVSSIANDFKLELGKNGVPMQLERVFHMMAVDHMKLETDAVFGEEQGSKSLNTAANLVKLAGGKSVPGITPADFEKVAHFDKATGVLEIKDNKGFEEILTKLEGRANTLWDAGKLQKGASGYLDDIKPGTWKNIIHANGLDEAMGEKTGITGHDDITEEKITDFDKSTIVTDAEKGTIHPIEGSTITPGSSSGNPSSPITDNGVFTPGPRQFETQPYPISEPRVEDVINPPQESTPNTNGGYQEPITEEQKITETPQEEIKDEIKTQPETAVEEKVEAVAKAPNPIEQTKEVVYDIYNIKNYPEMMKEWDRIKTSPVHELFRTEVNQAFLEEKGLGKSAIQLWKYLNLIKESTGLEPESQKESITEYMTRAGKEYLAKNPERTLDQVLEQSKTYKR